MGFLNLGIISKFDSSFLKSTALFGIRNLHLTFQFEIAFQDLTFDFGIAFWDLNPGKIVRKPRMTNKLLFVCHPGITGQFYRDNSLFVIIFFKSS